MASYDIYRVSTYDADFNGSYTLTSTTSDAPSRWYSDYHDGAGDDLTLFGDIADDLVAQSYLEYRGIATDANGTQGFLLQSTVSSSVYLLVPAGSPVTLTGTSVAADPSDPTTQWDDVNAEPACFMDNTLIATPGGATPVNELAIGDRVMTADGRTTRVLWIGRHSVHKRFTAPELFAPVRVTAGALGNGLPERDLRLTADHALILDGLAINAGALVNGQTIAFDPLATLPERITYFHVETEGHEAILANGAPAESFIDYRSRRSFDNFAEYEALYGEERRVTEMPLPRVSAARLLPPALRARLAGRSAA